MDLIYADENRKDIGVISAYDLDMAYGDSENDFACVIDRSSHCCGVGYFIYAEGTEYGGIVDNIKVDTQKDSVTYGGRTWHGMLERRVICPDPGDDYYVVSGEVNEVLQEVFVRLGLSDLFAGSSEDTGVNITDYQFDRYCCGYTGIRKMLKEYDLKLCLKWTGGMVVASAEPIRDFSQDEEFDTSQVEFTIDKNYRPVNHLVCLGQGDLKERAVIHLFTDEAGGVQPYLIDPDTEPVEDADYILDTSRQVLTGPAEVMEAYDAPSAEITTNYVQLSEQPEDWEDNCTDYYTYESNIEDEDGEEIDTGGEYKPVEMVSVNYELQEAQPTDWSSRYNSYYSYNASTGQYTKVTGSETYRLLTKKPGNWSKGYGQYYQQISGVYAAVKGETVPKYTKQKKRPSDWKVSYKKYYFLYSDGLTEEYRSVQGVTYYTYERQTRKPSDWATSYASYYRRATAKELKTNKNQLYYQVALNYKGQVPLWKAKKYYTRKAWQKAPSWKGVAHYTRTDITTAPAWAANTYYQKMGVTAPAWAADTYYTKTNLKIPPEWVNGKYYRQAIDRYAVMVADAIERLAEYHASDKLDIDLEETDQVYDVGDIVGTREEVTGMEAIQEVTKKIIRITNDDVTISYEVN